MLNLLIISLVWIEVAIASDPVIEQVSPNPANVGEKFSLLCKAEPSRNLSSITWIFSNGSTIFENEIFHLEGNIGEILIFKDVQKTFNGVQFVCFTTSLENTTTKSKPFTLIVKESISKIEVRQSSPDPAIVGQNYSLLCYVETPSESCLIHWSLSNDSAIVENDAFKLDGIMGQMLTIENVKQSYLGLRFICATIDVDNSTKKSQPFSLIIVASPEIEFFEDKIYSQSGQPFSKDCLASGYPYPVTKWYQGNIEVQQTKTVFRSVLVIPTVAPNTLVNYTCKATVSLESIVLSTNRTFTLVSYDIGVQNREESFTNGVEYKYSIFIATIVCVILLILVLTVVLCGYLKISQMELLGLEQSSTSKESDRSKKKIDKEKKKDKKRPYNRLEEPDERNVYEPIDPVPSRNHKEIQIPQQNSDDNDMKRAKVTSSTNEKNSSDSQSDQPKESPSADVYETIAMDKTIEKTSELVKNLDEKKTTKAYMPPKKEKIHPKEHSKIVPNVPFRDYPAANVTKENLISLVDERMPRTRSETSMDHAGKKRPEKDYKSPQDKPRVQSVQSVEPSLYDDVPNETTTVTITNVDERTRRSGSQLTMDNAGKKKSETTVKNPGFDIEQLGLQIAPFNLYDDVPTENTNDKEMLIVRNVDERMTRTKSESFIVNAVRKMPEKFNKILSERPRVQSTEPYLYDDVPNEKTVSVINDDKRNSNTTAESSVQKRFKETTKKERDRATAYESYKETADLYVEHL